MRMANMLPSTNTQIRTISTPFEVVEGQPGAYDDIHLLLFSAFWADGFLDRW